MPEINSGTRYERNHKSKSVDFNEVKAYVCSFVWLGFFALICFLFFVVLFFL